MNFIKGPISQEDLTIINIYAPNKSSRVHETKLVTELIGEINNSIGDFNTLV